MNLRTYAIMCSISNHNNCRLLCLLLVILKVISANSVYPDQTAPFRSSLIWVHTVCRYAKNSFEKFARIFSRRHKQTTLSDAVFLGAVRVNDPGFIDFQTRRGHFKNLGVKSLTECLLSGKLCIRTAYSGRLLSLITCEKSFYLCYSLLKRGLL